MDPGGSIASVWPHPLPPASVPSFADNSTPNSSPPAPSHPFPSICLSFGAVLSVPLSRDRFYHSYASHGYRTPTYTYIQVHVHAPMQGSRERVCVWARSWLYNGGGCAQRRMFPCSRREFVRVRASARARATLCTCVGAEGAAVHGVTHFLAFHLFCLPTLFTPEPYFVNGPHAGRQTPDGFSDARVMAVVVFHTRTHSYRVASPPGRL